MISRLLSRILDPGGKIVKEPVSGLSSQGIQRSASGSLTGLNPNLGRKLGTKVASRAMISFLPSTCRRWPVHPMEIGLTIVANAKGHHLRIDLAGIQDRLREVLILRVSLHMLTRGTSHLVEALTGKSR